MTLEDTIELMKSEDYKDRFVAEYAQTKIRYDALYKMIIKAEAKTLDFDLTCPLNMLLLQKRYMSEYLKQLEIRAEVEGIVLPEV